MDADVPAAADVGYGDDAVEVLHEDEPRDAEAGLQVDVEAAVAVQQRRAGAVARQALRKHPPYHTHAHTRRDPATRHANIRLPHKHIRTRTHANCAECY